MEVLTSTLWNHQKNASTVHFTCFLRSGGHKCGSTGDLSRSIANRPRSTTESSADGLATGIACEPARAGCEARSGCGSLAYGVPCRATTQSGKRLANCIASWACIHLSKQEPKKSENSCSLEEIMHLVVRPTMFLWYDSSL
jgi:hypothetical protein